MLLLQKWEHDAAAWESLTVAGAGTRDRPHEARQRRARRPAGRLARREHRPGRFGDIFRRNMPYGTVTDHGTMFVGFAGEQRPLVGDAREHGRSDLTGTRDALTRYTHPLTGAYYFVPSTESVRARIDAADPNTL